MKKLEEYQIVIPTLNLNGFYEMIEESEDESDKNILTNIAKAANMLNAMENQNATPGKLGWFAIWNHLFSVLKNLRTANLYDLRITSDVLSRKTLELFTIVQTIIEPLKSISEGDSKNNAKFIKESEADIIKIIVERFEAYTVWCLWNDYKIYKSFTRPKTLDQIWNAKSSLYLYADEERLKFHERFFGKLDMELDQDVLNQKRVEMKKKYGKKIKILEHWFLDKKFIPWISRIKYLEKVLCNVPFFTIFDESIKSVRSHLKKWDIEIAYLQYSDTSMQIHNSSFNDIFQFEDSVFFPTQFAKRDIEYNTTLDFCIRSLIILESFKEKIWSKNRT